MRGWVVGLLWLVVLAACRARAPQAGAPGGPRVLWATPVGTWASPDSSPVLGQDGSVYTPGSVPATLDWNGRPARKGMRQGCLHQVEGASGSILRTLPGSVIRDARFQMWARVSSWGTAYAVDSQGGLYGMFANGGVLFRAAGQPLIGPPAITQDGRLLVGSWKGVFGFELEAQGDPAAFSFAEGQYSRAPVLGADGTFYAATLRQVYAVDAMGEVKWGTRAGRGAPVLDEAGRLYVTEKDRLIALDPGGSQLWEYRADDDLGSPALAADGTVVVIGAAGLVQAVGADGARRWSFAMDTAAWSMPAAGPDGALYVSDRSGRTSAIEPGGRLRWSIKMSSACATPAVGGQGVLYVECQDGKLYAVSPS